ncbi:cytoskeleton-associated protein 2-like [Acanthaster planci]|uniref:Cytoskeleton-associated protein 2-like n=1 Tax=Acanthaster planci TaxID=133434 RepID=A0A8B7Y4D9_ACAPL|nr:cytoskeleton-associated protein 2-like [Acanthaster planci]
MESAESSSEQDIMLERLARWKAQKALKKQYTSSIGKAHHNDTKLVGRQPLKEARLGNRTHNTKTQHTSTSKRQAAECKSNLEGLKTSKDKRSNSSTLVEKAPEQEMTMREKLELWRAQKQPKNNTQCRTLHLLQKKESTTGNRAKITPSSKATLPPQTSSLKGCDSGKQRKLSILTPKKDLFRTPTSVKSTAHHSANLSMRQSTARTAQRPGESQSRTTEPHHTTNNNAMKSRLAIKRSSPTQEEPSRKRKVVTFLGTDSLVRCSPRLQERSRESTEINRHGQEQATPVQPWKDKKLDMQQRLKRWLASKGKTPSKYSHLLSFKTTPADRIRRSLASQRATPTKAPMPVWHLDSDPPTSLDSSTSQEEDELMAALNSTMDECSLLLQSGCPTDHVTEWLDSLVSRVPAMRQCSKYWLCRVSIAKEEELDANEIIHIYEEAVQEGAQPVQAVKESLQQYVEKLINTSTPTKSTSRIYPACASAKADPGPPTPKGSKYSPAMEQLLQSSVLRYCLTESTPYFDRIRAAIGQQAPSTTPNLTLVTPVRRSIRLEGRRSVLPLNLQEHNMCLASLDDLAPQEFILRANRALEGDLPEDGPNSE